MIMMRIHYAGVAAALIASALIATVEAQQLPSGPAAAPSTPAPAAASPPPPTATTKVTDNVYIFRYVGHQSMFIVTPAGVIATDPISLRRPAKPYIDAIQAVTKAPIK
jgi:hypothetical protein